MANRVLQGDAAGEWGAESETSEAEPELLNAHTGRYRSQDDAWNEALDVQRGSARMRLDLKHGFHKHIVKPLLELLLHYLLDCACTRHPDFFVLRVQLRESSAKSTGTVNACSPTVGPAAQIKLQQERDAYEQQTQQDLPKAGAYQQWLRGVPEAPHTR